MEGMQTREDVEFFSENGVEAQVAHLRGVDRDVLVLLLPLLLPQNLRILGMSFQFSLTRFRSELLSNPK